MDPPSVKGLASAVCVFVCGVCVCVCVCVAPAYTLLDNPLYVVVGEVADRARRIDRRLCIGTVGSTVRFAVFVIRVIEGSL